MIEAAKVADAQELLDEMYSTAKKEKVAEAWEWPELKHRDKRSTDSNSDFSFSSCFFSLMISLAKSRTSWTANLSFFSEPIFKARLTFQIKGKGELNMSLLIRVAFSKAAADLASGRDGNRCWGSYPKAILQMLSDANLSSMSWMWSWEPRAGLACKSNFDHLNVQHCL